MLFAVLNLRSDPNLDARFPAVVVRGEGRIELIVRVIAGVRVRREGPRFLYARPGIFKKTVRPDRSGVASQSRVDGALLWTLWTALAAAPNRLIRGCNMSHLP
jgi:hypothetical protein